MMDEEDSDDMMGMDGSMTCGDDVMKVSMAEHQLRRNIMFHDADRLELF